ncbi:MAG: G8 domain-containing protein [Candidatus Binatus sp.]
MAWVSTRWFKTGSRAIAQFVSIAIVLSFGFICTVSASGASSDTSLSPKRLLTSPDATTDTCPDPNGDPLGPGNAGVDLLVTGGTCMVNTGSYMYRNINIIKGGTLQFNDAAIDLYAANIIIENAGTMRAGSVDATTGVITPIAGPLRIHLYGANQGPGGVGASCKTDATCGVPNKNKDDIWQSNDTMKMYPDSCKETKGLPGGVDDCFYSYDALPFDNGKPTDSSFNQAVGYYGYKVLAVGYGGTLQLYGKKGATYDTKVDPANTGTSWARLNNCNPNVDDTTKQCKMGVLQPGANTLILSKPVDWQVNDNIVIASTDYLPGHAEQVQITCVNDSMLCPGTMKFTPALKFPHNASVYSLSKITGGQIPTGWTSVDTRAAVALLTRSIRIDSYGDTVTTPFPAAPMPPITPATQGYYFGGHMVIRQGFEKVQIQGVEFYQMGQGGRIGHYPVHFHMARKVPTTTFVKDDSVWDSMTRWYVLHATQGVLMARNVGYESIGHGYYLEDGTETNNKLYANVGIFARAAVTNIQNPRNVPGILAAPDYPLIPQAPPMPPLQAGPSDDVVPYHSDWDHPTVFWIMNAWNDFENNMAAGAGTCGVCYWVLPGINSGMSRNMKWESYASEQQLPDAKTSGGTTPLQIFTGNSCVSAMSSFLTVANTTACNGVQIGPNLNNPAFPVLNQSVVTDTTSPNYNLAPSSKSGTTIDPRTGLSADNYYPHIGGGGRFPTTCPDKGDCSTQKVCSSEDEANCVITNIDHYTSSFNWQATNFAAIWLRPLWYLFINSALTDVQNGGITFVTGGGYTKSDAINGHWALARKDVFIGNTQNSAASGGFASNVGPFNPGTGLKCAQMPMTAAPGNYCLDADDGVSFALATFANNQRLFSIYDGPAYEDSNAYLDITRASLPNDPVLGCNPKPDSDSSPDHNCANSVYSQAGKMLGMPYDPINKVCYLPNAAIAWKQPNGFYYPPAFHSRSLFFSNVDIRHFVIEPLFKDTGLFVSNPVTSKQRYCTYDASMFTGFTDIDRQTELNDDDGTLTGLVGPTAQTGLVGSVSVNQDAFFNAPLQTPECLSDVDVTPTNSVTDPKTYAGTAVTSPYDYVTTVVFPDCAASGKKCDKENKPDSLSPWNADCTNQNCYGVPLYRENLIPKEIETSPMGIPIRLMGQANFQRSSLTVNNGRYYVDTSPSKTAQSQQSNVKLWNVFQKGGKYYVFLVFAKATTKQTYDIYVGKGFKRDNPAQLWLTRVKLPSSYEFDDKGKFPQDQVTYDENTGILSVTLDMSKFPNFVKEYADEKEHQCQPKTFCQWIAKPATGEDNCQCADSIFSPPTSTFQTGECSKTKGICSWATTDVDCPKGGCYGFGVKLSDNFDTSDNPPTPAPQNVACLTRPVPPPDPPPLSPYDVKWTLTTNSSTCNYATTNPATFCTSPTGAGPEDSGSSPDATGPDDSNGNAPEDSN